MLGGSGDGGVDLVAQLGMEKYAIQVKRYSKPISRNAVSDAVAGKSLHRCKHAMVITNSYFTPKARDYARRTNCQVIDGKVLKKWIDSVNYIK
ncbi:MAG: restriction endonuclease [Candidatus Saccharimonadales bacterium]